MWSQVGPLEEFIASIEEKDFGVVAVNRRLRMKRVPCHIVENLQHETMNPIEEARAFKRYVMFT